MPDHLVQMLLRRRIDARADFIFPSSVRSFRHPNNFRTRWREALAGTPYAGTTPKAFRKSVATVLRNELGVEAAQDQLGHAHSATTGLYTALAHQGPTAAASVLESLFSPQNSE